MKLESSYWEVRRAIAIVAYFGGLRMAECLSLELEKINRAAEGYQVMRVIELLRDGRCLVRVIRGAEAYQIIRIIGLLSGIR